MKGKDIMQICGLILISSILGGCGQHRSGKGPVAVVTQQEKDAKLIEELFYRQTDTTQNAWNNTTEFFHYWKEMEPSDYLFSQAPSDSISSWKARCEELNNPDDTGIGMISSQYVNMNQYVTIHDLLSLWGTRSYDGSYDDFTLWRIDQFRSDTLHPTSTYEKFSLFRSTIDSLSDFEAYYKFEYDNWSTLNLELQEIQARLLLRGSLSQSEDPVKQALQKEESAWGKYYAKADTTYQIVIGDPNHFNGSMWGQAIMGIMQDNALIRYYSLADYCFCGDEKYHPEVHGEVSNGTIIQEYARFMDSFEESEYHYPEDFRRQMLTSEMHEWELWMRNRDIVSSLLSGSAKTAYDNSTNNARRMKYIMLKNRYEGYGVSSDDVYELLIPYTAPDEEITGPSFDVKWKSRYGHSL